MFCCRLRCRPMRQQCSFEFRWVMGCGWCGLPGLTFVLQTIHCPLLLQLISLIWPVWRHPPTRKGQPCSPNSIWVPSCKEIFFVILVLEATLIFLSQRMLEVLANCFCLPFPDEIGICLVVSWFLMLGPG